MKTNAGNSRSCRVNKRHRLIVMVMLAVVTLGTLGCELAAPFSITPPQWLLGTWSGYVPAAGDTWTWSFTPSDIIWTTSYGSLDFFAYEKNSEINMEELVSTSTEYQIEVVESGELFVFRFVKTTDSSLRFYDSHNGVTFGPCTFAKSY